MGDSNLSVRRTLSDRIPNFFPVIEELRVLSRKLEIVSEAVCLHLLLDFKGRALRVED